MASDLQNVVVDCANPWELARFWSAALDRPVAAGDPDDDEVGIGMDTPGDGHLLFIRVPESKRAKNRLHLCLRPRDTRDAEVERLLGLGATVVDDLREPAGPGWAVLADPEGNEFCVLRSASDRARTTDAEAPGQ